jgi:ankyrin repeat protein
VQIVKELLKFGADVMALDSPYCQTPLHISAKSRMLRSRA